MRSLISALAAAGLLMFTLSGYSADPAAPAATPGSPVMSKPDPSKPGRTIEESTVTSKPDPSRPGRKAEEEQEMNAGTAEEDQAVQAGGTSEEPASTVEKK
jgi:hypothetical protein